MDVTSKARFWTGVLYPENMVDDWQTKIGDLLQLPFAYCIHNMSHDSKSEHRKDHIHVIIAFPNTTTYATALRTFDELSAPDKKAVNTCQQIINVRHMYDYLIHDTDTCRKQGKELYDKSCRITGNNFDIGAYEQIGAAEKNEICKELCNIIIEQNFINFGDFYMYVMQNYEDSNYFDVLKTYSGLLERLTKSNFQKWQFARMRE